MNAKLFIATTIATLSLSAYAHEATPDTIVHHKNRIIKIFTHNNDTYTEVSKINDKGDTVLISTSAHNGARRQTTYLSRKIRIPFVPDHDYSYRNNNRIRVSGTSLGLGYGRFNASGGVDHLNLSDSYRFTLGLLGVEARSRYMALSLGSSFEWNRFKLLDFYTLQRNASGVTQLVPPSDPALRFKKNQLNVTYLNLYTQLKVYPLSELRNFWLYGYGAVKFKNKSKAYSITSDGKTTTHYNGDRTMRGALLEVGGGIGYGSFGVQMLYTPYSYFADDKGPDLRTTTISLTFGF